jgi:metallo-beta-lactamase family protein
MDEPGEYQKLEHRRTLLTVSHNYFQNVYNAWMKFEKNDLAAPSVSFLGAAQSVSGSMHLIQSGPYRYLLDCGVNRDDRGKNGSQGASFPFDPASIDAVFLSHAHMDHCGNLPYLIRQGFRGPIYCTHATRDLIDVMLNDGARINENRNRFSHSSRRSNPSLFDYDDVDDTLDACVGVDYLEPVAVNQDAQICFHDAGHILGSASIAIDLLHLNREIQIYFTGDLGRRGLPFVADPTVVPPADLIICESTYGGRVHDSLEQMAAKMAQAIGSTLERNGKVLIPAFSLGRTQLVLHYLQQWMTEGLVPKLPIFIDNFVASEISQVHDLYDDLLVPEIEGVPFEWLESDEEATQRSLQSEPCIILASGGMCDGGRILHHLRYHIDDPRSTIITVSFQASDSLGAQLLSRSPRVRFDGRIWNKWIEVAEVKGFSGHADQNDFDVLMRDAANATSRVRLVHGEPEAMRSLQQQLTHLGFADVAAPRRNEIVYL